MRIGILTFWWSQDNYGQLLQCYALQKYLRDAGHDAFLIRYYSENDYVKTPLPVRCLKALNPVLLCKYVCYKINVRKSQEEKKLHDRHFDDFRSKYIVQSERLYSSYGQLKDDPPDADCYVVGSDQVWNFGGNKRVSNYRNLIHAYFLDFGKPETKRISYAASWSCIDLHSDIAEEIRPLLARFDYVSVREKSGVGLCRACGCGSAELVLDPTLLLGAEDYRALYRETDIQKRKSPYMLLYMLGNECDFDIRSAYDFASQKNLEVVYVTGNSMVGRHKKTFATIPEWLSLVDNAECVITNSFHCCVFSTIFGKRFGAVALSRKDKRMNARLESLFEMTGTGDRLVTDMDFSALDKPLDSCFQTNDGFDIMEVLDD